MKVERFYLPLVKVSGIEEAEEKDGESTKEGHASQAHRGRSRGQRSRPLGTTPWTMSDARRHSTDHGLDELEVLAPVRGGLDQTIIDHDHESLIPEYPSGTPVSLRRTIDVAGCSDLCRGCTNSRADKSMTRGRFEALDLTPKPGVTSTFVLVTLVSEGGLATLSHAPATL